MERRKNAPFRRPGPLRHERHPHGELCDRVWDILRSSLVQTWAHTASASGPRASAQPGGGSKPATPRGNRTLRRLDPRSSQVQRLAWLWWRQESTKERVGAAAGTYAQDPGEAGSLNSPARGVTPTAPARSLDRGISLARRPAPRDAATPAAGAARARADRAARAATARPRPRRRDRGRRRFPTR